MGAGSVLEFVLENSPYDDADGPASTRLRPQIPQDLIVLLINSYKNLFENRVGDSVGSQASGGHSRTRPFRFQVRPRGHTVMHRRSVKDCSAVVTGRPWRTTVPTERNNPAMELGSLKFRVSREEFADSVAWVARSLPSRPPVPVLGGVLLDATEQGLTVSGFDYEVSARSGSQPRSVAPVRSWSPASFSPTSRSRSPTSRST